MSKAHRLTEIIRSQVEDFAAYPEEWVRFLMSPSSQNYKLRFDEKVMLYHEAPDANLVATVELWNKLNIGVKRGSKGIPVLAGEPGSDGKVKYYFSVKDTINRGQTAVFLWSAEDRDRNAIMEALGYEGRSDGSVEDAVRESVRGTVLDEADSYLEQLVQSEDFLESDEGMQAALMESFSDLVVESSVLLVMNRIGIYPNAIDTGKFARIRYFSSFPLFSSIAALTNAVSTAKIEVVKRAIKENRRRDNGIRIPDAGRNAVPGTGSGRSDSGVRGVRNAETELLGSEQAGGIHDTDGERGTGAALPDSGQGVTGDGAVPDPEDDGREGDRRETESKRPDEVDPGGERSPGGGERDRAEPGDIQIEEAESESSSASSVVEDKTQVNPRAGYRYSIKEDDIVYLDGRKFIFLEFKNETVCVQDAEYPLFKNVLLTDVFMEKVRSDPLNDHLIIRNRESREETNEETNREDEPVALRQTNDIVDDILRTGGGRSQTLYRISAKLQEGISEQEFAEYLKADYGIGGKGFTMGNRMVSIWYDGDGIRVSFGKDSARKLYDRIVSWEEAGRRIREMYAAGRFVSNGIMSNALDVEREELAGRIYFFYRDTRSSTEAPEEWNFGNYPATVEAIKKGLEDKDTISELYRRIDDLYTRLMNAGDSPWYALRRMPETLTSLAQLRYAGPFTKQDESVPRPKLTFITQDEIDDVLRNGGGVEGGKFRIFDYFSEERKREDQTAFLKHEYGIGGRGGFAITGSERSDENHDGKGIVISKGSMLDPEIEILIRWEKAAERIRQLIEADDYLTSEEMQRYDVLLEKDEGIAVDAAEPGIDAGELADDPKIVPDTDTSVESATGFPVNCSEKLPVVLGWMQEAQKAVQDEPDETLKGRTVTIDRMDYEVTEDDGEECVLKNLADSDIDGVEHLPRKMPTETVQDYVDGLLADDEVPGETGTQRIHNSQPETEAIQYKIRDDRNSAWHCYSNVLPAETYFPAFGKIAEIVHNEIY